MLYWHCVLNDLWLVGSCESDGSGIDGAIYDGAPAPEPLQGCCLRLASCSAMPAMLSLPMTAIQAKVQTTACAAIHKVV